MKTIIIAGVVAALVAASTASAALIVTSANIKNGTIKMVDISAGAKRALKGNRGPAGPEGPPGLQGSSGAQGPAGIAQIVRVDGPADTQCSLALTCPPGESPVGFSVATCPTGSYVVGGGFSTDHIENWITDELPGSRTYAVIAVNYWDGDPTNSVQAQAICASGPGITASATAASDISALHKRLAEVREAVASGAPSH